MAIASTNYDTIILQERTIVPQFITVFIGVIGIS